MNFNGVANVKKERKLTYPSRFTGLDNWEPLYNVIALVKAESDLAR